MQCDCDTIQELIEYDLKCAKRYRRSASLIMIGNIDTLPLPAKMLCDEFVRDCDLYCEHNGRIVILMAETEHAGALNFIQRLQREINLYGNLKFSITTFPNDGHSVEELILIAERRLQKAIHQNETAVIAND